MILFCQGQIITGGYSELPDAGSDPALGHLMDFLASEVRNSMFQVSYELMDCAFQVMLSLIESRVTLPFFNRARHVRSPWMMFRRWRGKWWPA